MQEVPIALAQCLLLPVQGGLPGAKGFAFLARGLVGAEFVENRLALFRKLVAAALQANRVFALFCAAGIEAYRINRLAPHVVGLFIKLEGPVRIPRNPYYLPPPTPQSRPPPTL